MQIERSQLDELLTFSSKDFIQKVEDLIPREGSGVSARIAKLLKHVLDYFPTVYPRLLGRVMTLDDPRCALTDGSIQLIIRISLKRIASTDTTVQFSDGSLRFHKAILQQKSDFFKAMLCIPSLESNLGYIDLRTLSKSRQQITRMILDHWYGERLNLTRGQYLEACQMADYFQSPELKRTVLRIGFSQRFLTGENCNRILGSLRLELSSDEITCLHNIVQTASVENIPLSDDNIYSYLTVSDFLNYPLLKHLCEDFLLHKDVLPSNYKEVFIGAKHYALERLQTKVIEKLLFTNLESRLEPADRLSLAYNMASEDISRLVYSMILTRFSFQNKEEQTEFLKKLLECAHGITMLRLDPACLCAEQLELVKEFKALEYLDISLDFFEERVEVDFADFQMLTELPQLRHLNVNILFDVSSSYLLELKKLKHLEELSIRLPGNTEEARLSLACLQREFTHLKGLFLHSPGVHLSKEDFLRLSSLTRLEVLEVGSDQIDDDFVVSVLSKMPGLKNLNFARQTQITASGLRSLLLNLPRLEVLDISLCRGIVDLASSFAGVNLELLSLKYMHFTAEQIFSSANTVDYAQKISDMAIIFARMPHFRRKMTLEWDLTDDQVNRLLRMDPRLNEVAVATTRLSRETITALCEMPALKSLSLSGHMYPDQEGLDLLNACPALTSLAVFNGGGIQRPMLQQISRITRLVNLELHCSFPLQDSDLNLLDELPHLRHLMLKDIRDISDEGLQVFRDNHPHVEVMAKRIHTLG